MKDADGKVLGVGDIIQMRPDAKHEMYRRCIGIVTEIKPFGAVVDFLLPGYGVAPLRVASEEMTYVGRVRHPIA